MNSKINRSGRGLFHSCNDLPANYFAYKQKAHYMKTYLIFVVTFLFQSNLVGELPEAYKHVDQMIWVVDDLTKTVRDWNSLGFTSFSEERRDEVLRATVCDARFGEANVTFIHPDKNEGLFGEFLQRHGPGVFSLVHRFASDSDRDAEVERLATLSIGKLEEITLTNSQGDLHITFMDTAKEGKYVLGFSSGAEIHSSLPTQGALEGAFIQYAFAIKESDSVSQFWEKIGLPKFKISHSTGPERTYYGKPANFVMDLGWQRHGDVAYEWCIEVEGPTIYQDHIDRHGEGVQHIGWKVPDMDKAIAEWEAKDIVLAASGVWGKKGTKGSGRYAYMDTDAMGGLMVELLWFHP